MAGRPQVVERRSGFRGRAFSVTVERVAEPGLAHAHWREVVRHGPSVTVIALDGDTQAGRLALVRQYRHAAGRAMWELPAGGCRPGESPLRAARRELREETGLRARRWQRLGRYFPSPGILDEEMYVFLARDLTAGAAAPEGDERLRVGWIPVADMAGVVARGGMRDGKALAAWTLWRAAVGAQASRPTQSPRLDSERTSLPRWHHSRAKKKSHPDEMD